MLIRGQSVGRRPNETRDWRIWAVALWWAGPAIYAGESFGFSAYALDSTTIESFAVSPRFRRRKGGIKVHTLMDLRGTYPLF